MGYSIQYGKTPVKQSIYRKMGNRRLGYVICVAAVVGICIAALCFTGSEWVRDVFIPGDADVTQEAFSEFIGDVRSGSSVHEAFSEFCKEIIEGAQLT